MGVWERMLTGKGGKVMKLLSRESGNKWMDSNNKIGMNREKGVRLRLMSAILVITSVKIGRAHV